MKETIQDFANETTSSNVRGSTISNAYLLEGKKWLDEIMDAAQLRHVFMNACVVTSAPKGHKDVIIPYRKQYMRNKGTFTDTSDQGSAVTFTTLNNLEGLQLTPSPHSYGVAIPRYALNTNVVDLIRTAKEELTYNAGDVVDAAVAAALRDAGTCTSSANGSQELYGGDASTFQTIESGDILTEDLIADAKTRLQSKTPKYWNAGSQGNSSANKNAWLSDPSEPFLLYISSENENALIKSSQFVNASEYGSNDVVMNGEIGNYLGFRIMVSENTPASGDGGQAQSDDWGAGSNVPGHMCLAVKAKKSAGFAWGQEPDLQVFDYPREQETNLILYMEYDTDSFYDDAIVKVFVSDS